MIALNLAVPSLLNFYWRSSDPVRWERFLRYIIRLHSETVGPFTRRPVTTALLHQLYLRTHDAWIAFLALQGTLLASAAFVLGITAAKEDGPEKAWLAPLLFFLSFTVLFSFVTPNDSFDEPAQYLFFFLALFFLRQNLELGFACALFLACLARETTLLLLPGLWLLDRRDAGVVRRMPQFVLPILAWALFYFWKEAPGDPGRFLYWIKNFGGLKVGYESILSFALALAPAAIYFGQRPSLQESAWARAFLIAVALNTPIVFFAAYARESRLLALPLLFLWPRLGSALRILRFRMDKREALALSLGAIIAGALIWCTYVPNYRHVLGYRIYASLVPALLMFAALNFLRKAAPQNASV
ncbi:MAG: hypothetical protein EOP11_00845 [Proteobacteria bacterium]|nr:MAG: hypothetical protein EOP11_00845 [Pseudomonadota bacterium]